MFAIGACNSNSIAIILLAIAAVSQVIFACNRQPYRTVLVFFLFLKESTCCGYSLEAPE